MGGRELPVFLRLVEPLHEAVLLFFTRNVEKEFEDQGALAGNVVFEMCNVGKPFIPDMFAHELWRQFLPFEYFRMHTDDQNLFVILAVENSYASALRQTFGVTPHEIMVEVLARGLLEREDLAPLGVYARHDVFDRSVLAGRIHRLKDQQYGPAVLRVEHFLLLGEPLVAALKTFSSPV